MLKQIKISETIILFSLVLLMVCSGGLTWYGCIFPTLLLLSTLIFGKTDKKEITINHMLTFLLVVISLISVAVSKTNKVDSLNDSIKTVLIWTTYSVGRRIKNNRKIDILIFATSALLAFIGILAYCNILKIENGIFYADGYWRLQSTLGYANTAACILGCGYLSFLNLYEEKGSYRWIFTYVATFMLIAFFLTFSKGAVAIVLLLFAIIGLVLKHKYVKIFVHVGYCGIVAIVVSLLCVKHMPFVGFITILIASYIMANIYNKYLNNLTIKYMPKLTFIAACVCIVGGVICISIFPEYFSTFTTRLKYMRDALDLIKENPVFGIGTGAWDVMQYKVQQTDYAVRYIHNGWLQFLVENGLIFLLALVVCCIISMRNCLISIKQKPEKMIRLAMLLFIMIHSLIDFDFGYGITLAYLGLILASMDEEEKMFYMDKLRVDTIRLASVVCVIFVSVLMIEFFVQLNLKSATGVNDYTIAERYNNVQQRLFPYDSTAASNAAAIAQKMGKDDEEIVFWLNRAQELSPYDPEKIKDKIQYCLDSGSGDIIELCTQYINMQSKVEEAYVYVASVAKRAFQTNLCTKKEVESFLQYTTETMRHEGVIDRNEILHQMMEEKRGNDE